MEKNIGVFINNKKNKLITRVRLDIQDIQEDPDITELKRKFGKLFPKNRTKEREVDF